MCLLCVEIQKDKMTAMEIARAWKEMPDDEHWVDVLAEIIKIDKVDAVGDALTELTSEADS